MHMLMRFKPLLVALAPQGKELHAKALAMALEHFGPAHPTATLARWVRTSVWSPRRVLHLVALPLTHTHLPPAGPWLSAPMPPPPLPRGNLTESLDLLGDQEGARKLMTDAVAELKQVRLADAAPP